MYSTSQAYWKTAWDNACEAWPYIRAMPQFQICQDLAEAQAAGLSPEQLALFRLDTRQIWINGPALSRRQLWPWLSCLMAHELGHAALMPINLQQWQTLCAAAAEKVGLARAAQVANIWADLLINTRLQTQGWPMVKFLAALDEQDNPLTRWLSEVRRRLWRLAQARADLSLAAEAEALLAAELLTKSSIRPEQQLRRFAELCVDHVSVSNLDPILDLELTAPPSLPHLGHLAQHIEPSTYLAKIQQILPGLDQTKALSQYYRERAWPYLLSYWPYRAPRFAASHPESPKAWEWERPIQEIDWTASLIRSPLVIPGLTTVRQQQRRENSETLSQRPYGLDLYLDMSSSVPDPRTQCSPLVLAASILILSALRARVPVRITGWSGTTQQWGTPWTRHAQTLLEYAVAAPGGPTAFPLALICQRAWSKRKTWRVILSDQGALEALSPTERLTLASLHNQGPCALWLWLPTGFQLPCWPELVNTWHYAALSENPQHISALCQKWWKC